MKKSLVTVIVITYNSEKFVIATLESIKQQTYKDIELVISDDSSKDKTISVVEEWLKDNKDRFVNSYILKIEKNTGISCNCNRGLKQAKGDYVKIIAGDDLLLPNCIEDNVSYAIKNNISFLFSKCIVFDDSDSEMQEIQYYKDIQDQYKEEFNKPAELQYKKLLKVNFVFAPSGFMQRSILNELNGFDEKFMIEDYPLWLRLTRQNIKLDYMDINTVRYRINNSISATYSSNKQFFNKFSINENYKIYKVIRRPYLSLLEKINEDINQYIYIRVANGKNDYQSYRKLQLIKLLSPYLYIKRGRMLVEKFILKYCRNLFVKRN